MYLFIDTHELGRYRLGWIGSDRQDIQSYEGRPHTVLKHLMDLWSAEKLDGVCVVEGPGSFSAIRVGVLYANLIARIKHIPLISLKVDEPISLAKEPRNYVAPLYDAEPNITQARC